MKEFVRRNISAWLPMLTSPQERTRTEYRFGRRHEWVERRNVTSPLITGAVLVPDFEMNAERWRDVPGTLGELRFGDFIPSLTSKLIADLRNIEAIGNTPKSKRERHFEIGQLVRVVNGPFRSFCGRVERFDSPGRLSVGVEIFGRITPTELGEGDIETVKAGASY
jgi:transcriptional antiterminator NusG